MQVKLITIGNSRGIRIPKAVIDQYEFGDEISMELEADGVKVRSVSTVRKGWDAAFARMRKRGDDRLLDIAEVPNSWDETEWTW